MVLNLRKSDNELIYVRVSQFEFNNNSCVIYNGVRFKMGLYFEI